MIKYKTCTDFYNGLLLYQTLVWDIAQFHFNLITY